MKKLLLIPFILFSLLSFGQFTKPELYQGINTNIRNKSASQFRLAAMLDSIVVSMGSGGGSMVYPSAGLAKSTGSAWGTSITAGAGVETWLTTPSWTNFNSAITGTAPFWKLGGNASTVDGTDFIGTTDNIPFNIRVNNNMAGRIESSSTANTFYGYQTGISANTDNVNTGFGFQVMGSTTGGQNTGVGFNALFTNTTGAGNTAIGKNSLRLNLSGNDNTAVGVSALQNNSTAIGNTAVGRSTLGNATAGYNTAIGGGSLSVVTTGTYNTAIGYGANVSSGSLTNATAIGNGATVTASNTVQIGNASVTTINMGTSTTAKVVSGGLQITGGTLSSGNVLTSDASGNASWAAPSGGGLTVGTSTITSGSNTKILYNNAGVLGEYTVSGSGNVAMTTSPTFTTPDIGTATGTASGDWHLTGTSTLTGAVNVVGSATNKFKFTIPSLGTSVTDEFLIENNTAATLGNQQGSGLVLGGYGWKTTSTAASQSVKFQLLNTPVQGTTNPSGLFSIKASINGAAYGTDLFSVTSSGDGALSSLTLSSNRYISFSGGVGSIYSSGNAGLSLRASDGTTIISGGAVRMWNVQNFSATSGNQIHLGVEIPFAPTSGTATMTALNISGVINQTGGANGAIRGLYYNPTLTALGGTNRVIDATSGDINLAAGDVFVKGTGTGTGKGLTISDSGSNERFSVQHNGVINVNGSGGTAGQVLVSNGTSAAAWTAPSVKTSTTKTVTETIVRNMGTLGASSTASSAIRVNADYGNSTTLIADITVYAIKSDGSASVMGKVTGRYRKNSSGTFSVDDAGTTVTSDVTILLSIVPEINGTNPQVQVNTGASAANYDFSFTAVCSYITY